MAGKRLPKLIELLALRYEHDGRKGEFTDARDPFLAGVLFILGTHAKRNGQARSFEAMRRAKGVTPGQLLDIDPDKFNTICQLAGPYEDQRARELYAYADEIEEKCGKDFPKIFKKPLPEVRKVLETVLNKPRSFADFVLMYSGFPVFAVDEKVARVASRLGFGKAKKTKAGKSSEADQAALQKDLEAEAGKDAETMIRAHGLLFRHATDTCHATTPACDQCPLIKECQYVIKHPFKSTGLPTRHFKVY